MPRDGSATREKIMDAAEALILERGYGGTSLDAVIDRVGLTKGAFFYHFKSKNDLAVALIERFAEADDRVMRDSLARAEKLSSDPLQQLLVFVGLFVEMFEGLTAPYPGCLFAAYIYELQQFDEGTRDTVSHSFVAWRKALGEKIEVAAQKYPPRLEVDAASLADAFTVIIEGAYITSKALDEPQVVAQQLRHFRNYLELLFSPA